MSGLVTTTSRNGKGSGYANSGYTFKRFTSSISDWPVPFGCTIIVMECIGPGGGAGGGAGAGGGGGGGSIARLTANAQSLLKMMTQARLY